MESHTSSPSGRLASWLSAALFFVYAFAFAYDLRDKWFNPRVTTDDALQQLYPFWRVIYPEAFPNDLITKMMECYLSPLHYGVSWLFMVLTRDPVMMGHWVMLVQVVMAVGFMFLAVRRVAGTPAAFFAAMWLLHTRNVMQRLTGGLPRGWAAGMIAMFLYFVVARNHRGVLLTILIGCLLHPPSTLMIAVAYGLFLLLQCIPSGSRREYLAHLRNLAILSPVYIVCVLFVVRMPEEIGRMASYSEASQIPEFTRPGGRFAFVPLYPVGDEVSKFAFQAFLSPRIFNPGPVVIEVLPWVVLGIFCGLLWCAVRQRREIIPREFLVFFVAIVVVYFASRLLAFRLYVPDRHLQFPLALFFIAAFSAGVWRACVPSRGFVWRGCVGLGLLALVIWSGSTHGLHQNANFNVPLGARGKVFAWFREATSPLSITAGDPTYLDFLQLASLRTAYVTTETAHPFYDRYNLEMRRRLQVVWRAYYAKTLRDLVQALEGEPIDYFLFERRDFYPEELQKANYFLPHSALIRELVAGHPNEFAFREIPREGGPGEIPYLAYRDERVVVLDVVKLREFLAKARS